MWTELDEYYLQLMVHIDDEMNGGDEGELGYD